MFGFLKKKEATVSSRLDTFLNTVDMAYMNAFSTKSVRNFQQYASRECALNVSREIYTTTSRFFSTEKFRTTKWIMLEDGDDGIQKIKKSVVFDTVRVSKLMDVKVQQDYSEIWTVDTKNLRVLGIEAVS